jgi:hypothetical protein
MERATMLEFIHNTETWEIVKTQWPKANHASHPAQVVPQPLGSDHAVLTANRF